MNPSIDAAAVLRGERRAVARALNAVEGRCDRLQLEPLWQAIARHEAAGAMRGLTLGLTGPPGVGKSTLAGRLVAAWRAHGLTVGVLCIDPSSRQSGGALLGDRLRMRLDDRDDGVFVRSLAARERLGGLADAAWDAAIVMRAAFDRVLVETVGVGQSETDVARLADLTAVVVQPASGDVLQFLKAGLMEVFDLLVVNKSDLGLAAEKAVSDLRTALRVIGRRDIDVAAVSAETGAGIEHLVASIETAAAAIASSRGPRRLRHDREHRLEERILWHGLKCLQAPGSAAMLRTRVAALPDGLGPAGVEALLDTWLEVK